ncbi:MAG: 2-hydroxychromene-2-carboxylate isomerase [Gammaproteobacteria bacterium]
MKQVDVFFDVGSPATYLAFGPTARSAAQRTTSSCCGNRDAVGWRVQGNRNQSPIAIPAKGKYTLRDFQRHAQLYGVLFQFNPHFPINTLQLMRAPPPRWTARACTIIWLQSSTPSGYENMGQPDVVAAVLAAAGFEPQAVFDASNTDAVKEKLKLLTEEAVARGVFGAPTFIFNDEMFFGQDRLEFLERVLRSDAEHALDRQTYRHSGICGDDALHTNPDLFPISCRGSITTSLPAPSMAR